MKAHLLVPMVAAVFALADNPTPYPGQQNRLIKALSQEDIAILPIG